MSDPVVSVVIPAKDAAETLGRTLECLRAQDLEEEYEVIVVDDGSVDDTARIVEDAGPEVRVVRGNARGAADARNLGAAEANARVIAFTDADCFPESDWLTAGLAWLEKADLVQGAVHPDPATKPMAFDHTVAVWEETGLFETANLFVRAQLFDRLGGFEEVVSRHGGRPMAEDAWFGWRARRSGARYAFASDAVTRHVRERRGGREFVEERIRLREFPTMFRLMPELRSAGPTRIFLSGRTAAFDAAAAGVLLSLGTRRGAPLLAAVPYAVSLARRAGRSRWAPRLAAVELAADAVGALALVRGSVEARTPLL